MIVKLYVHSMLILHKYGLARFSIKHELKWILMYFQQNWLRIIPCNAEKHHSGFWFAFFFFFDQTYTQIKVIFVRHFFFFKFKMRRKRYEPRDYMYFLKEISLSRRLKDSWSLQKVFMVFFQIILIHCQFYYAHFNFWLFDLNQIL